MSALFIITSLGLLAPNMGAEKANSLYLKSFGQKGLYFFNLASISFLPGIFDTS